MQRAGERRINRDIERMKDKITASTEDSNSNTTNPKVHSSFSMNSITSVFSRFSGEKEQLLNRIGLGVLMTLTKQ